MDGWFRAVHLACASLLLAACAAAPGSDAHKGLGQDASQGAAALVVWVPDRARGRLWLQFEKRNAQGEATGIPVSVLVETPSGPPSVNAAAPRAGWKAVTIAFPLAPGGHLLSRWVGEVEGGKTVVSPFVGWAFDVQRGQLVHLGHLDLRIDDLQDQSAPYRMTARPAGPADLERVQHAFAALRGYPARPAGLSDGRAVTGVARLGGTKVRNVDNNISVHIP
jgi:hypothetical protein